MNFKKLISKILHIIVFDEKINTNDLDLDNIKVRKKLFRVDDISGWTYRVFMYD